MENQSDDIAPESFSAIADLVTRIENKETKIIYDRDPDGSFSAFTLACDSFHGELIGVSHGLAFKQFDFTNGLLKDQAKSSEDCKTLIILDHEVSETDLLSIDSKLPSTVEEVLIVDHHPKTMEMVKSVKTTHKVVSELLSIFFTVAEIPSGRRCVTVTPAFDDRPYSTSYLCDMLLYKYDAKYMPRVKTLYYKDHIHLRSMIDTYDTWTFAQRGVGKDDVAAIKGLVSHLFLNGDMYFNPDKLIPSYRNLVDNIHQDVERFRAEFETTVKKCQNVVKKYMTKVSLEKSEHSGKKFGIIFHSDHMDILADEALLSDSELLFVVIAYMKPNGNVKCSIRVRKDSDINLLHPVSRFGGGGHAKACGVELKPDNFNYFLYQLLPNL